MYTLRFPFSVAPGQTIGSAEAEAVVGDRRFTLERQGRLYVLSVDGFSSEAEATNFIGNLWAGLMWVVLTHGIACFAGLDTRDVTYFEDRDQATKRFLACWRCLAPRNWIRALVSVSRSVRRGLLCFRERVVRRSQERFDGVVFGDSPAVYRTEKKLAVMTPNPPTIEQEMPSTAVLTVLCAGASYPKSALVIENQKLRLALELYAAHFIEVSASARFLTLIMAIEVLTTGIARTPLVISLLEKWNSEVTQLLRTGPLDLEDIASLEGVQREILFREEDSLRRRVRRLVRGTLQDHGDSDAEQAAQRAVEVYDLRSALVHEVRLDPQVLGQALADAKSLVGRVLRVRFMRAVE